MTAYRALFFTAPYQVEIRELPLPKPGAGEVLTQTRVSAISAGTEMLFYRGQIKAGTAVDATIEALAGTLVYPLQYGYAAVGEIIELGKGTAPEWLGKLVFAFQPHVSHFTARPEQLIPVPQGMAPETAVFLPNMETAVSFLMDSQPMIGEQALVLGQGIVGLLTTALLANKTLAALAVVDRYPLRRSWGLQLGADFAFDPSDPEVQSALLNALQGKRPYRGADLTFELSGNPAALELAVKVTGYNGRILVGSWYGNKQVTLDLGDHFHRSHMRLISSQVSHIAPQWNGRFNKERRLDMAWRMLARIKPQQLITDRLALNQAAAAYGRLDQTPQDTLQIIFQY